jgi:hypothetical protein
MLLPDISEFQSGANLAGIKEQNGGGVIIRAAYGVFHKDLVFDSHRAAAHAADFSFVGLYQYLVQGQDPINQAKEFCSIVGALKPGEIPIIDLEEGDGSQLSRANAWMNYIDGFYKLTSRPLNFRSWLYSYEVFIRDHDLASVCASIRHTWVAKYDVTPPSFPHSLWQSTDGVDGVNKTDWSGAGFCDTNVTGYTLAQLAAMAFQLPPVPPVTPKPEPAPGTDWLGPIMASLPVLKQGDNNNDVRTLQGLLGARGHAVTLDGDFGPTTASTLKSVQSGWGLPATGQTDPNTWAKLLDR